MAKQPLTSTGERGIYFKRGKYQVRVAVTGKLRHGGTFATLEAAIVKRDELLAEQGAARKAKAQINKTIRKPAPRPDLGTFVRHGKTKARERHVYFTPKKAREMDAPLPQKPLFLSRFVSSAMDPVNLTSVLYLRRGTPLAAKGNGTRGDIGEFIVAKMLRDRGDDVRARTHVSHDLVRIVGGQRQKLEVKLGRMHRGGGEWKYEAARVKPDFFDVLYLCYEGLSAIHVFEWGGNGLTGCGDDKRVVVGGDNHVLDPDAAEKALLHNIVDHCNTPIGVAAYDDPAYAAIFAHGTKTEREFATVPFGTLPGKVRGDALEALVAALLQLLRHSVAMPTPGRQSDGDRRRQNTAECDRLVDGVPCEFKSSLLQWNDGKQAHYELHFQDVKADLHDDRYLAWLTPRALHVWRQPKGNNAGLCGKKESQQIVFRAPSGRQCLTESADAEEYLLKNLAFHKLEYLARLDITPGDYEKYASLVMGRRVKR